MKRIRMVLAIVLVTGLLQVGVSSASAPTQPYTVPEIKTFSLLERTVVAIAIEDQAPGKDVDSVLEYRLVPLFTEKRLPGKLEITLGNTIPAWSCLPAGLPLAIEPFDEGKIAISLTGPDADRTAISTVRRKTVKTRDGWIRMRTYLVFNISREIKREIPTIVIDPGHGGEDTGAVKNFIFEKDLNLDIGLRTARLFERKGWNVVMTRTTDVEPALLERADAANLTNATVFISIHNNSLPEDKISRSREFGTTVLYNSQAVRPAYDLARMMQEELVQTLGTQREVLQDRPKLVVLNSTWVPAVLTEGIMMPNPANAKLISDRIHRQRTAEAILRAVETWRGQKVLAAKKTRGEKYSSPVSLISWPPRGGNHSGNTTNRGVVACIEGWIYYLRKADTPWGDREDTLWRFRPDRFLSDERITDQELWDINVGDNFLYYSNWSEGHSLYRSNLDGSNPQRLTEGPAQQISLAGEKLIFVRDRKIFTMPKTGGIPVMVVSDVAENVVAWADWIYYANGSDGFKPYRIKFDGTGRKKIVEDETLFLTVAGEWLFYSNLSDGEKLYRVKTDGTSRRKVSEDRAGYLNLDNHYVYYTNTLQGDAVFRIRPDGSGRMKIMDGGKVAGPIGIAGGKIYYQGLFKDLK